MNIVVAWPTPTTVCPTPEAAQIGGPANGVPVFRKRHDKINACAAVMARAARERPASASAAEEVGHGRSTR